MVDGVGARRMGAAVGVALLLVAFGAWACTRTSRTALRVEIVGLPGGVAGQVSVAGPDGSYVLTGTDERTVAPGPYTLAITSVDASGATYYTVADQQQVTVVARQLTIVTVDYRIAIPDTTRVLAPADVLAVAGTRVDLVAGALEGVEVGNYIVAADGPAVTGVLVRRVTRVDRLPDRVVLETAGAAFDEALPKAVISLDTAGGLQLAAPAAHSVGAAADPLVEVGFSLRYEGGVCSPTTPGQNRPAGSLAGSLTYGLESVDLDVDGEIAWDTSRPSVTAFAQAVLNLDQTISANIEAAVRCAVEQDREVPLICGSVLGQLVRIGPIRLGCDFRIVGSASVQSQASWHAEFGATSRLGFNAWYDSGKDGLRAQPVLETELTAGRPEAPRLESRLAARLGFQVALVGSDPAGIATVGVGLRISAGPVVTSTPMEFTGEFAVLPEVVFQAGLGFVGFEFWSDEVSIPLGEFKATLWHVGQTAPASSPPTPSPSPASAPGTGPEVDWSQYVQDCSEAAGGPGLGTEINDILFTDVTGDVWPEWVVVDECRASTSPWPDIIEVFAFEDSVYTGPIHLATLLVGDPAYPRNVKVVVEPGGRLVATGEGLSPRASTCCPDLAVRRVFVWNGAGFTLAESIDTPL